MIPNPENIFAALFRCLPRGTRAGGESIPPNMRDKLRASETRAWAHSAAAGHLWEAGFSASRAIATAKKIATPENNSCGDAGKRLSSRQAQQSAIRPGGPGSPS
jgi:hypothetical protein